MIIGYLKSSQKNMVKSRKFIGHLTHPRNDDRRHFWDHLAAEELTASAALKWDGHSC